ncbi:hypothetical protein BU16DRAFT_538236 [Lophium mytilinum]|uniref:Zincin n=1 Tax=Lophium mytilinum TaxID=390894 RepID=A0A6A6QXG6_9PEZI|nr:hypothetical protein BU16DRAFT_538236 [Lophium mytilinum]
MAPNALRLTVALVALTSFAISSQAAQVTSSEAGHITSSQAAQPASSQAAPTSSQAVPVAPSRAVQVTSSEGSHVASSQPAQVASSQALTCPHSGYSPDPALFMFEWPPSCPAVQPASSQAVPVTSSQAIQVRLKPWFHVKQGPMSIGGCDSHLEKLEAAYEEAIILAQGGAEWMEKLRQPRPNRTEDRLGYLHWNKASKSVYDIFGITVDPWDEIPPRKVRSALEYIGNAYRAVAEHAFETESLQDPIARPKLFCGDKFATKIKKASDIQDEKLRSEYWSGVVGTLANVDPGDGLGVTQPWTTLLNTDDFCPKGFGGATDITFNYTFICPSMLSDYPTIGHQRFLYDRDENPATQRAATSMNEIHKLSTLLLHEFFHLYTHIEDHFEIMADESTYLTIKPPKQPGLDSTKSLYGYNQSYMLARIYPENAEEKNVTGRYKTLQTVDTYVMFAKSMFFEDFTFEGFAGWARPIPGVDLHITEWGSFVWHDQRYRFQGVKSKTRKLQAPPTSPELQAPPASLTPQASPTSPEFQAPPASLTPQTSPTSPEFQASPKSPMRPLEHPHHWYHSFSMVYGTTIFAGIVLVAWFFWRPLIM